MEKFKEFSQNGAKIRVEYTQGTLRYSYFCGKCGRSVKDAKLLKEYGYYSKVCIYKCPCGHIYRIYD